MDIEVIQTLILIAAKVGGDVCAERLSVLRGDFVASNMAGRG